MADRLLSRHAEPFTNGFKYTIEVERSAAGAPGILITTEVEDANGVTEEVTIDIPDGIEFLKPVVAWLRDNAVSTDEEDEDEFIELNQEQANLLNQSWWYEQARLRHVDTDKGQAKIDSKNRDKFYAEATNLGVPDEQASRFVFGHPNAHVAGQPKKEDPEKRRLSDAGIWDAACRRIRDELVSGNISGGPAKIAMENPFLTDTERGSMFNPASEERVKKTVVARLAYESDPTDHNAEVLGKLHLTLSKDELSEYQHRVNVETFVRNTIPK